VWRPSEYAPRRPTIIRPAFVGHRSAHDAVDHVAQDFDQFGLGHKADLGVGFVLLAIDTLVHQVVAHGFDQGAQGAGVKPAGLS
jgi:hypothetical protein